jgi:hypothetical protein
MSTVYWNAAALCTVACALVVGACGSDDTSTPQQNGGSGATAGSGGTAAGGEAGTGATGGTAGTGTGGSATGGAAGTGTGGSATGGTAGTGGGSSDDSDCDLETTEVECSACCVSHHPAGDAFLKAAQLTCICTTCETECAATVCATPPVAPDDACKTCAGPCNKSAMTECASDTDCAAMLECGKTYCADKS